VVSTSPGVVEDIDSSGWLDDATARTEATHERVRDDDGDNGEHVVDI